MTSGSGTGDRHKAWQDWVLVAVAVVTLAIQVPVYFLQKDIQSRQAELSRQVAVADRYNALAEQLGSDNRMQRIAGTYGLRDLAEDQPSTRLRTIKVLAAYLVLSTEREDMSRTEKGVAAGTLAALTRLEDADQVGTPDSANNPLSYDLSWVSLPDYSLVRLRADRGYFFHIDLVKADLAGSVITCTDLSEADLSEANLAGARLDDVLVEGARLTDVRTDPDTEIGDLYWDEGAAPEGWEVPGGRHAGTEEDFRRACEL